VKRGIWENPWFWFSIFATALVLGVGIYFTFLAKMDLAFLVPESETVAEEPVIEETIEPLAETESQPPVPVEEEVTIPELESEAPEVEVPVEDPNAHLSLSYFRRNPLTKDHIGIPGETEGYHGSKITINAIGHIKSIDGRNLTIRGSRGSLTVYIPEDTLIVRFKEGATVEMGLGLGLGEYYEKIYKEEGVTGSWHWPNHERIELEDLQRGDRIQIWMWIRDDGSVGIFKVHKLRQQ